MYLYFTGDNEEINWLRLFPIIGQYVETLIRFVTSQLTASGREKLTLMLAFEDPRISFLLFHFRALL